MIFIARVYQEHGEVPVQRRLIDGATTRTEAQEKFFKRLDVERIEDIDTPYERICKYKKKEPQAVLMTLYVQEVKLDEDGVSASFS